MYNLNINFSNICKKCETSRERFKFNNLFHSHIRDCIDDESKLSILTEQKLESLSMIKSRATNVVQKNYDFRSYQFVTA